MAGADAVFQSPDNNITASSKVHGQEGKVTVNSPLPDIGYAFPCWSV
jgi:hypothetical protein